MSGPDLTVAVARELGYQRTGARIRAVVDQTVQRLLQEGVVVEAGGNLRIAAPDA